MLCTHVCVHAFVLLPGAQGSSYIRTTCDSERGGTTSLKSAEQPFLWTWHHPFFLVCSHQLPWQGQLKEGCVSGLTIQRTGYHDGGFKAVGAWSSCHIQQSWVHDMLVSTQFCHLILSRISKESPTHNQDRAFHTSRHNQGMPLQVCLEAHLPDDSRSCPVDR